MGYVIKVNRSRVGYWTGDTYTIHGKKYAVCSDDITSRTKVYKYEKAAQRAADAFANKFGYLASVEKLEN